MGDNKIVRNSGVGGNHWEAGFTAFKYGMLAAVACRSCNLVVFAVASALGPCSL